MQQTKVEGLEELKALSGRQLGSSDWLGISQQRVNQVADANLDHQ